MGTVAYSLTDPNLQFRIELKNGKYYLYSVGAGLYVNASGNYVATASTELKIQNVGGSYPWKLVLGSNGMNSQDGGQTDSGILVNSWTTTDAGNCYQIIEAGEMPEEEPGTGIQGTELKGQGEGIIYDLLGRPVKGTPVHGVYIVDGKKVVK